MSEDISLRAVVASATATVLLVTFAWAVAVAYGVDTQYESTAEKAYHTLMLTAMIPAGWCVFELSLAVRRQEADADA